MILSTVAHLLGGPATLTNYVVNSDLDLAEAVRHGLPPMAVDALVESGTLSSREAEDLVIPRRTLAHRKKGQQLLTPEESDRLARIARIAVLATEIFEEPDKAARWLRKPNRALAGAVPLELLSTGEGGRIVEGTLIQIGHGVFS